MKTGHTDAVRAKRESFELNIYNSPADKLGFTQMVVFLNGKHPLKEMLPGTIRTYVVFRINKPSTFTINDITHQVVKGDQYIIKPGSTYWYEGDMILLETNISPENIFKDKLL